jgi:hypothetical protein
MIVRKTRKKSANSYKFIPHFIFLSNQRTELLSKTNKSKNPSKYDDPESNWKNVSPYQIQKYDWKNPVSGPWLDNNPRKLYPQPQQAQIKYLGSLEDKMVTAAEPSKGG